MKNKPNLPQFRVIQRRACRRAANALVRQLPLNESVTELVFERGTCRIESEGIRIERAVIVKRAKA